MRVVGKSDVGMVRSENQDAFWLEQLDKQAAIAVVCDGMGGVHGGQEASKLAVASLKNTLNRLKPNEKFNIAFDNAVKQCNQIVYNESQNSEDLSGMGTTLVLALVKEGKAYVGNVGDSRAYHITNGSITQITKDHSAVQELVDSGHITERQAKIHPNKNVITRAIGISDEIDYDYFEVSVSSGDIILLCSDGLSNYVDENEIQFEASGGEFDDLAIRLINLANSRGGTDNITVTAIQV